MAKKRIDILLNARDRASGVMNKVGRSMAGFAGKAALAGAAATAAAVAGIAVLTKQGMASVDATAKLADRVGIATEALAGLRHAAELSGAGSEKLDAGLQVLQKRLGEVATKGTGSAKKGLDQLGLSAKELIQLPLEEQVALISERMRGLSTQAEKNAATAALFSRGNQQLVNTLELGRKGLARATEEAKVFGAALARWEHGQVEAANDALSRAGTLFASISKQLAVQLSPYIEAVTEGFLGLAKQGPSTADIISFGIEQMTSGIAKMADYLELGKAGFYGYRAAAMQALADIVGAFNDLGEGITNVLNLVPGVDVEFEGFRQLQEGMQKVAIEQAKLMEESLARFESGVQSKRVKKFFEGIEEQARKNAQLAASDFTPNMLLRPKVDATPLTDMLKEATRAAADAAGIGFGPKDLLRGQSGEGKQGGRASGGPAPDRSGVAATMLSTRFLGEAQRFKSERDHAASTARNTGKMADLQQKNLEAATRGNKLLEKLAGGSLGVGGSAGGIPLRMPS